MKYVLYRYGAYNTEIEYVANIYKGKVIFTLDSVEAKRFSIWKAMYYTSSYRLNLIHERYIPKG